MQTMFSKWAAVLIVVMSVFHAAAHPGHLPSDFTAEVSQPLAGPDHFVAFIALTSVLLVVLRLVLNRRQNRNVKVRAANSN